MKKEFILGLSVLWSHAGRSEEQNYRSCADWSLATPLRNPEIEITKRHGDFRVVSRMLLRPEHGESLESLYESTLSLLSQGELYSSWVLPRLNDKAEGGRYFVEVQALDAEIVKPNSEYILSGPYTFKILFFERSGMATMTLKRFENGVTPVCPIFEAHRSASRFEFAMTPRPDLLSLMNTELWVLKKEKHVELWLSLVLKPSSLVYELMPLALMKSEVSERGRQIFQNFQDFRRAWVANKPLGVSSKEKPTKKGRLGPGR